MFQGDVNSHQLDHFEAEILRLILDYIKPTSNKLTIYWPRVWKTKLNSYFDIPKLTLFLMPLLLCDAIILHFKHSQGANSFVIVYITFDPLQGN